ncbi:uncharacterized protein LOC126728321 [Quercus robur]|uniref:uncharacterized protein LOC126728321 n=1 Tax=Quercus robur TaxID=38942 RepID=UPI0021623FFD|nr:uncharacterized protein LOC126728321 [Quercus robur]
MHGGKIQNPATIIQRARDVLDELKDSQTQLSASVCTDSVQKWRPPMGLAFKLTFDAAIFANSNSSGAGVIIRNSLGVVMAGLSACGPSVASSEEAEVLACRKALEFALDLGFQDLVVEGDNITVMRTMVSPRPNRSKLGHIYDDIWMLASGFSSMFVECVKRSANSVAHCLARYASQVDEDMVWVEKSPPPALQALYLDSMSLNE